MLTDGLSERAIPRNRHHNIVTSILAMRIMATGATGIRIHIPR